MLHNAQKLIPSILILGILSNALLSCNVTSSKVSVPLNQKPELKIGDISELKNDDSCSDVGDILVYAETQNYVAYICGNRQEPTKPAYFRAKSKNDRKKPSIVGKVVLGWEQVFFVGENKEYTYLMDIFPINFLLNDKKPYLVISPFSIAKKDINRHREQLTKYLSIEELRQAKTIGLYWIRQNSESSLKSKKSKFIKYLRDNKERLKVCKYPPRVDEEVKSREDSSKLYKVEENKYLLEYRCNLYLRYSSYNFFLISEQNIGFEVKSLTQPKILKDIYREIGFKFEDRIIYGIPSFNPREKILSICVKTSYDNGSLSIFSINKDQFELIEFKHVDKDENLYIDPVLYPRLYP